MNTLLSAIWVSRGLVGFWLLVFEEGSHSLWHLLPTVKTTYQLSSVKLIPLVVSSIGPNYFLFLSESRLRGAVLGHRGAPPLIGGDRLILQGPEWKEGDSLVQMLLSDAHEHTHHNTHERTTRRLAGRILNNVLFWLDRTCALWYDTMDFEGLMENPHLVYVFILKNKPLFFSLCLSLNSQMFQMSFFL